MSDNAALSPDDSAPEPLALPETTGGDHVAVMAGELSEALRRAEEAETRAAKLEGQLTAALAAVAEARGRAGAAEERERRALQDAVAASQDEEAVRRLLDGGED